MLAPQARSPVHGTPPFDQTPVLSVGVISADLRELGDAVQKLTEAGVKLLHFDVMDGHFAPQLTMGPCLVRALPTNLWKDVHLMIEDPLDTVHQYVEAGADLVTIHVESSRHVYRVLQKLQQLPNANHPDRPVLRGLALLPSTPIAALEPLLDQVELVLLVAVNPGFAGQTYLPNTAERYGQLTRLLEANGRRVLVGIDGGVTAETIPEIARLKPDLVVAGNAVFRNGAICDNLRCLTKALAVAE